MLADKRLFCVTLSLKYFVKLVKIQICTVYIWILFCNTNDNYDDDKNTISNNNTDTEGL